MVVATAVVTAILFFFAPNKSIGSDVKYTLLVSRAILHEGTIRLDHQLPDSVEDNYRITETNGHLYYTFPYGASFIVSPFVGLAEIFGYDVRRFPDEVAVQKWLLAATGAILVVLSASILRIYLSSRLSWLLSLVLVWGSVLAATFGSALWNLNLSVLFILSAVCLLARHHAGRATTTRPILLGLLLALGFICRPTTAVFILIAFLYLLLWNRREFWPAAGAALVGLLLFLLYNQVVMGVWLPPYYLPQRLESRTPFIWALSGLLFSPSRGLLIFSPVVVYILGLAAVGYKGGGRQTRRMIGLLLLWLTLHLFIIARFDHWWGGFSYGPRLLTDVTPALIWLTAVVWPAHPSGRNRLLYYSVFAFLAAFSIYFNLYTGLYNPATSVWNGGKLPPNIDRAPQYLFDWRYPQFLATEEQNCRRNSDFFGQLQAKNAYHLSAYPSQHTVVAGDAKIIGHLDLFPPWMQPAPAETFPAELATFPHRFYVPMITNNSPIYFLAKGWFNPVAGRLQSACAPATFLLGPMDDALAARSWRGHLLLETTVPQSVKILVNNRPIVMLDLKAAQETYTVTIPAHAFSATGQNEIQIAPAEESQAEGGVWRAPPIFFYSLTLGSVHK